MGNKKNKRKRNRRSHLMTARANARRTNTIRWSDCNKENDETMFIGPKPSHESSPQFVTLTNVEPDITFIRLDNRSSLSLQNVVVDVEKIDENNSLETKKKDVSSPQFVTLTDVEPDITLIQPGNTLSSLLQNVVDVEKIDENNSISNSRETKKKDVTSEEGTPYSVEPEKQDSYKPMTGRRILDINYFFKRLQEISSHKSLFNCNTSTLELIGEKRTGLISKFKLKCKLCGLFFKLNSDDPENDNTVDINTAAVSSIISTGIGYSQFEEMSSAMDIPVFTEKYYAKIQNELFEKWEATAVEAMERAAAREREAAIAEGRTKNGIPMIDVYADGAWCTRSYGNNYRALSGVAAIVGRKFGEVIYVGVKNKYCLVCSRASKKGVDPKDHCCYKNYEGSSSGMEAEIICEGFKSSIEMYGLIYANIVADGDSSMYAKLLASNPYSNHVVGKIECRNHVLRNMCNKLRALAKDTKYPLAHRKLMNDVKVMSMRKVVCLSIKTQKDRADKIQAIQDLHANISQSINHAFGDHRKCSDHYCSKEKSLLASTATELEHSSLWFRIKVIINNVASKSRSLIEDVDTNAVERFNSVVAKFIGGKRINFGLRRSYQARCSAAVVAFNTRKALHAVHKKILGHSPNSRLLKKMERKREQKNLKSNLVPRKKNRKRQLFGSKTMDHDYGNNSAAPDMPPCDLELAKRTFLDNLEDLASDREAIQQNTILQRESSEWLELRRNMLTASNFGQIIKRKTGSPANLVKNILYKTNIAHVASVAHGIKHEDIALQQLAKQENLLIEPCGLFIDKHLSFLGASPDGTVGSDDIVEVKCPVAAFKKGFVDAKKENKIQILKYNKKTGTTIVNKNSSWYYQAQGQLHVSGRKRCIFGIWGGETQPMEVIYIKRDDVFWSAQMEKKLVDFYMDHLLPELVDSRQARGMPIRGAPSKHSTSTTKDGE